MKYLLSAFVLWTVSASANPNECSSIWVFKAWKPCSHQAHGPNTSAPGQALAPVEIWSKWFGGNNKPSQEAICSEVEGNYNLANTKNGRTAALTQATPVREERRENRGIYVEYKYLCRLNVTQYPFIFKNSRACGEEEKTSYKVGGSKTDIAGSAYCLSCDEYTSPKSKVTCLKTMITEIINVSPAPVDLRDSDKKAVAASIKELMEMAKMNPIQGLSDDVTTFRLFNTFVQQNPTP